MSAHATYQRDRYARLRAEGCCVRCQTPVDDPDAARCATCARELADWMKARRVRLILAEFAPLPRRCARCGTPLSPEAHHDERTCRGVVQGAAA